MIQKNNIQKSRHDTLGKDFIPKEYLAEGKNEYDFRMKQNKQGFTYRTLHTHEIDILIANENTCTNWSNFLVGTYFDPTLIQNCRFYGLIRIGSLSPACLQFSDMQYSVGLYHSTIINCDFGNNVAIDNVHYLSHYIIGNETIIVNVQELATTHHAKFGNGILKEGEKESARIELEIWNENGRRSILPFSGMLAGDAYLWSRYRNNEVLMDKFKQFTSSLFSAAHGEYGEIGDRTIIKNSSIIKDVKIGDDAYIKGANKLKNLTIHSGASGKSQIGEGCELVNGIIHEGCRVFYGVKAVRFIMASHSQLKYGARLINSYLGNNATISCCEVLNSLIFPLHEQHHNNSFLCASLVMGQSNIPAGATLGSNHNSRSADGEMIAGRGFWPGLCVNTKHNSRFASFTMLGKGSYNYELDIQIPFSLVSQDEAKNCLQILPGYWFLYNFYALERNVRKYKTRDHRVDKIQNLEFEYLAPDTVNELIHSLPIMAHAVGNAWHKHHAVQQMTKEENIKKGYDLLEKNDEEIDQLEICVEGFENSKRKTVLLKTRKSYHVFIKMIRYYAILQFIEYIQMNSLDFTASPKGIRLPHAAIQEWENMGGQLIPKIKLDQLLQKITSGKIHSWGSLHQYYQKAGKAYVSDKMKHGLAVLHMLMGQKINFITKQEAIQLLQEAILTRKWIAVNVYASREKDYTNPFRKMTYFNEEEMNSVLGTLDDNEFILSFKKDASNFKRQVNQLIKKIQSN
ncbi:MAG: DUF4954 family protein [Bacteroidetes bacterium]|nr:DUF4954 family protein [Bacteroidota bacterium]